MRAFGYVRLSKEREGALSIDTQRTAIERLCKRRGWDLVEWFDDDAESAFNGRERPAFTRMKARLNECDVIVFGDTDRLSRTTTEGLAFAEAATEANVSLVSVNKDDPIDTTSADGEYQFTQELALARREVKKMSERTRRGLATAQAAGHYSGRVPFGWKRIDKKLVADPKQQKVLRSAASRYVQGEAMNAIAKDIGMLTGPLRGMLHSDRVQAALPAKLREDLRTALATRRMQRVPSNRQSLLASIARCGECGGSMATSSAKIGGRYASYACHDSHVAIRMNWLDDYVTERVVPALEVRKDELVQVMRERRAAGRTASRRVSEIEARVEVLDDLLVAGKITPARFERMNTELAEQLDEARRAERAVGIDLPIEIGRDLRKRWPTMSNTARREVIRAVLERVVVRKAHDHGPVDSGRVSLVWREGMGT